MHDLYTVVVVKCMKCDCWARAMFQIFPRIMMCGHVSILKSTSYLGNQTLGLHYSNNLANSLKYIHTYITCAYFSLKQEVAIRLVVTLQSW